MKKSLAIILATMLLTSFVSCGNTQESSSESSSSTSEVATEEPTTEELTIETVTEESTTEPKTELSTENEEIILDSEWECDYLAIAKSSEWREEVKTEEESLIVFFDWGIEEDSYHFIGLELKKTSLGKMSEEDLKEFYEGYFEYAEENNENNGNELSVLDSFTKNNQSYILLGRKENDLLRTIHFSTDDIEGRFSYLSECEDIVMDMIDSIEFKEDIVTTEIDDVSNYETYENDFYTINISPEWDSGSVYDSKWFDISSNLKLQLWGTPTGLKYNNNKDFAEYWVNDANNDSRIPYESEVVVFGENYFAKSSKDECISYVCQNGDYINFFDFYFNNALNEQEEKIMYDILESVNLKYMNTNGETKPIIATEPPTRKPTSPPVKPTEPPTNPPVVVQKEEKTVYYTETGSKYHYDSKCGRGTYYPCTLDEALDRGLEPCKKCT